MAGRRPTVAENARSWAFNALSCILGPPRGQRTARGARCVFTSMRRFAIALVVASGGALGTFILIHTSNMVAIYFVGMLSATLLLRRWSVGWWLAVVATIMTAGLLVLAWQNLAVPLALAVAAVLVTLVRRVRRGRAASPGARASGGSDADADAGTTARAPEPALTATARQESS